MANADYWIERIKAEQHRNDILTGRAERALLNQERRAYFAIVEKMEGMLQKAADGDGLTATDFHTFNHLREIMQTVETECGMVKAREIETIEKHLGQIFDDTYKGKHYKILSVDDKGKPLQWVVDKTIKPPPAIPGISFDIRTEQLKKQVLLSNWSGQNFKVIGERNGDRFYNRIQALFEEKFATGDSKTMKRELQEVFGMKYHEAQRLIRTETNHVYNSAALERYAAAGVKKVRLLTLFEADRNYVCECEEAINDSEDGNGLYSLEDAPTLPLHPNCRCCYAPVFDDSE